MTQSILTLGEIADVRLGHPFRGAIPHIPDADYRVVKAKDIDENYQIIEQGLTRTEIQGRKTPDILGAGDILFLAKGKRNIATYINDNTEYCICGPEFFLIRIKTKHRNLVLPEFVSWQLNQLPAQKYFSQSSEGSNQVSIRKQVLDQLEIVLPSISEQRAMVDMWHAYLKEQQVLQKLKDSRTTQVLQINKKLLERAFSSSKE